MGRHTAQAVQARRGRGDNTNATSASRIATSRRTADPEVRNGGEAVARAVDLVKTYGDKDTAVVALDHVSVEFMRGQMTAIMGPSGSGKSTLMHCMAGLDVPTSGKVFVEGLEVSAMGQRQLTKLRREQIGFIFQSFNLVPTLSAEENILLPLQIAGRPIDRAWFDHVVHVVGLEQRLTHRPSQLSGGQQQRVACARALMARPSVIFADEPTGNLDSRSSREVLSFLKQSVHDYGQTIVMVTHDPRAASYADRVLVLADGRIVNDMSNPSYEQILDVFAAEGDTDGADEPIANKPMGTMEGGASV
ncbi:ABC transporter ATP-binding protein [Bifidobacterium tissieri]|uniref:ABC transporter ATP-binding protein n=1 Tax=Bifidobacterium tissieri TaxID=1630162 RepID=A0A261FG36_9BIFI|nr:ABC transporter ATP-binding protein [Bifidobacterium tissieri]OZG57933.1 ABC transporter ATP-binding protein [Bifidobacterium tissieri]